MLLSLRCPLLRECVHPCILRRRRMLCRFCRRVHTCKHSLLTFGQVTFFPDLSGTLGVNCFLVLESLVQLLRASSQFVSTLTFTVAQLRDVLSRSTLHLLTCLVSSAPVY